jgi:predicted HicB family RNase H-like nuclease
MERKKTGRPSKGERRKTTLRLPVDLFAAAEQYVQQHGGSLNDFMVQVLADKLAQPQSQQEALPISA